MTTLPESPEAVRPSNESTPGRLRLSVILASLAREGDRRNLEAPAAPPLPTDSQASRPLSRKEKRRIRTDLSVGEIIDRADHAGFGFMIGFLAISSIPFVGLSTPFGLAIALGAMQMVVGGERPWLPNRLRRHRVSLATLEWLSVRVARWTGGLERLVRPRFEFMTRGLFWSLCGLCVMAMALGLALPLPIPGSNALFAVPIILYAIGLLESDGLLIMLCHAIVAVQVALAIAFYSVVVEAVVRAVSWVGGLF